MFSQSPPLGEFDLIQHFFKAESDAMLSEENVAISLGIGDDCALLQTLPNEEIAITSDMLVSGKHFFADTNPEWLGHKALAVNLSDLAAMGAKPLGFTLAIALPEVNSQWLELFSKGLFAIAKTYSCPLIGGDTTAGPLNICITAFGSIPKGKSIRRSGATIGDDIWVSGSVGDARLTLAALRHEINIEKTDLELIQSRMHQPTPRVHLGIALRDIASAALDISDGLLGDLKHILKASKVDGRVFLAELPKSAYLLQQSEQIQNQFAACGGDDYELCFTAPSTLRKTISQIGHKLNLALTRIGDIQAMKNAESSIELITTDGNVLNGQETTSLLKSFDHFA